MLMAMLMAGYADDPYIYLFSLSFPLNFRFIISNCLIISTCLLDICLYGTQTPQSQHRLKLCSSSFLQTCPFSFDPLILPICPTEKLWDWPLFLCLSNNVHQVNQANHHCLTS